MEADKSHLNGKNEIKVTIPGIKIGHNRRPSTGKQLKKRKKVSRHSSMASTQKTAFHMRNKKEEPREAKNIRVTNTTPILKANHPRKNFSYSKPKVGGRLL